MLTLPKPATPAEAGLSELDAHISPVDMTAAVTGQM